MSDGRRPSEVAPAENLYRGSILTMWIRSSLPLSSAAFSWPVFSVNIVSLMSLEDAVRHPREVIESAKVASLCV